MRLGDSIPASALGSPPIVTDYFRGERKTAEFFRPFPKNLEAFSKQKHPDPLSKQERGRLAHILVLYQEKHGGSEISIRNAKTLGSAGSFAIVTGQQPGFLLGPLFTLLKAASAVRLALDLQKLGLPAVPVFWNHSEDHDLEETNHIYLPNSGLDLQKFRLPYPVEKKFLSEVLLDKRAEEVFDAALSVLPGSEFRPAIEKLFRPRIGRSLSEETSRILLSLFSEQGLVVVEPGLLRELSHLPLAGAVGLQGGLHAVLQQSRAALLKAGYVPTIGENQALLFEAVDGKRMKIESRESAWLLPGGKELSSEKLAEEIRKSPGRFSPGALLRPLTQCRSLPVAAYIGGPTEIAYSAENFSLFHRLGMNPPVMLPRFSATFLESSIEKALQKLGLKPKEALISEETLATKFPPAPTQAAPALSQIESDLEKKLSSLESALRDLDPTLLGPLEKTKASALSSLQKLREKVARAAQNRAGTGEKQLKKISVMLFPRDLPQERVLSPLYFFSRHGAGFLRELLEIADPFERDHRIVSLSSKENEVAHGESD